HPHGDAGVVWDRAFSPAGTRSCSGGDDATVRVWDAESGAQLGACEGHSGEVRACAFSPDGQVICSAGDDRTLRLWEERTGLLGRRRWHERAVLEGHSAPVTACAFAPDALRLCSASEDRTLRLWDLRSGEAIAILPLLGKGHSVALHPWRPLAVCGDAGGAIYLLDLEAIDYGPIVAAVDRSP